MPKLYDIVESTSGEYHIFKVHNEILLEKSECRRILFNEDSMELIKSDLIEQEVRVESARIGRKICGTCISKFYGNF